MLSKELSVENGDASTLGQKSNGCSENGAYGSDEDSERAGHEGEEDSAMETEEAVASSSSSATMSKTRKARRSKSNGENKSNELALCCPSNRDRVCGFCPSSLASQWSSLADSGQPY